MMENFFAHKTSSPSPTHTDNYALKSGGAATIDGIDSIVDPREEKTKGVRHLRAEREEDGPMQLGAELEPNQEDDHKDAECEVEPEKDGRRDKDKGLVA